MMRAAPAVLEVTHSLMIPAFDAVRAIHRERGDSLVVTTCTPAIYWRSISDRVELDLPAEEIMGKACSLALGVALARPDRKVLVLDADGSILMNLGSLVTVSGKAPSNLVHFVFQDSQYYTTGGQPIPAAEVVGIAGLAQAAGYRASYEFDDLEDLVGHLPGVLRRRGPVFVCLKVVHAEEVPPYVEAPLLSPGDW